jgi:hypothetical protein
MSYQSSTTLLIRSHIRHPPKWYVYGDGANRIRAANVGEELGAGLAARISERHAFIMAAAEDYQQERIKIALEAMPEFTKDMMYQVGDYVVAILPTNVLQKHKLQPKFRGIFLVVEISGENNSTV